jgi:hypothetical protein
MSREKECILLLEAEASAMDRGAWPLPGCKVARRRFATVNPHQRPLPGTALLVLCDLHPSRRASNDVPRLNSLARLVYGNPSGPLELLLLLFFP